MRLDDLILNFIGTLLLVFLFKRATLFVNLFRVDADLRNALLSLLTHLLEGTYPRHGQDQPINLLVLYLPFDSSILMSPWHGIFTRSCTIFFSFDDIFEYGMLVVVTLVYNFFS